MAKLLRRIAIVWNDGSNQIIHVSAQPDAVEDLRKLDGVDAVDSRSAGIYAVFLSPLYDRQSIVDDIQALALLPEIDDVWKQ